MVDQTARGFSSQLNQSELFAEQLEEIGNPLVKTIMAQVLSESSEEQSAGSAFGEGLNGQR